jgi:hypothetical protein
LVLGLVIKYKFFILISILVLKSHGFQSGSY